MSVVLLAGLLLGFLTGVGATIIWAACSTTACRRVRAAGSLAGEVEAALHRLDHAAEQVRALMFDIMRGPK